MFSLSFFCRVFPLALFFSYLFSFRVSFSFVLVFFFQQWRMTWVASSDCITDFCQNWSFLKLWRFEYYEEFKIWFSLFCRVLLLALFFSYLFLFRVYFVVTSDITILPASSVCITECCQKLVLLNLWRIKHCEMFEIWFFSVLLSFASRLFFPTLFSSCSLLFFVFLSTVISNWEAFGYSHWPTANIIKKKKAYNATE